MDVEVLKVKERKFDRKIREALELQESSPHNEHDLNQDYGQYVTTRFWKPMFSYLREKPCIDVVSLFTNVPLRDTIDIILKKVYDEQLIKTKITRKNCSSCAHKERHLLSTTKCTYRLTDGVMMGSPLGALFANIFMCELENTIIPSLGDKVRH